MSDDTTPMEFILPYGEALAVFLNQPYITPGILKKLLRDRGVYMLPNEKKELVEHLVLTYLDPSEFDYLFSFAREREDSNKMRNYSYKVITTSGESLEEILPTPDPSIANDPFGNSQVIGIPTLENLSNSKEEIFVWKYKIQRLSVSSDYMHSKRIFPAELRIVRKRGSKDMTIMSFHTSSETEKTNRVFRKAFAKEMKDRKFIKSAKPEALKFSDFNNQQRVAFFMEFTAFPSVEELKFVEISDFSLKLDEGSKIPDGISMSWMKAKVSSLKLKGKNLHDVFLLKDIDCRPHIFLWRIELKFNYDSLDAEGKGTAILEFGAFGRKKLRDSVFQISITNLRLKGTNSGSDENERAERAITVLLNRHKDASAAKVLNKVTVPKKLPKLLPHRKPRLRE